MVDDFRSIGLTIVDEAADTFRIKGYRGVDSMQFDPTDCSGKYDRNDLGLIRNNFDFEEVIRKGKNIFSLGMQNSDCLYVFEKFHISCDVDANVSLVGKYFRFNGFDIVDVRGFFSAICMHIAAGRPDLYELKDLNGFYLFDDITRIGDVIPHLERRYPTHAPFFVVSVHEYVSG